MVDALITMFGAATAPMLLSLAADAAILSVIISACIEMRTELFPAAVDWRWRPRLRRCPTAASRYGYRETHP